MIEKHQGLIPRVLETQVKSEVSADGKTSTVTAGYYHNQWQTQFKEKSVTTHQLHEKISQLQQQIDSHRQQVFAINTNMNKLRSVGHVLAKQMSRGGPDGRSSYDIDLNKGLELEVPGEDAQAEEELPDDLGVPCLTPSRGPSETTWG